MSKIITQIIRPAIAIDSIEIMGIQYDAQEFLVRLNVQSEYVNNGSDDNDIWEWEHNWVFCGETFDVMLDDYYILKISSHKERLTNIINEWMLGFDPESKLNRDNDYLEHDLKNTEAKIDANLSRLDNYINIIERLNSQISEAISDKDLLKKEIDTLMLIRKKLKDKIEAQKTDEAKRKSENEVVPKNPIGANDDDLCYDDFKTCF